MKKLVIALLVLIFAELSFTQNVGIGTTTPTSALDVNGQITIDQKNFGGYGGLLIKGAFPGLNYPNIGFSALNIFNQDIISAAIGGEIISSNPGTEAMDLSFMTSQSGLAGLSERLRIRNNGDIGIGIFPSYKLHIGNNNLGMRIEGPNTSGGTALSIGGNGVVAIDKPGTVGGRFFINENGFIGIGNNNPNTTLTFAPVLGKKITLYPGNTGDVGFAVAGNRLQVYSDNPNADVAIGYDAAGIFNEKFAFKPNGAFAISNNTGTAGQILVSNGNNAAAYWGNPSTTIGISISNSSLSNEVALTGNMEIFFDNPYTITLTKPSILLIQYKYNTTKPCSIGSCDTKWELKIYRGGVFNTSYSIAASSYSGSPNTNASCGPDIYYLPAGTHTFTFSGTNLFNEPKIFAFQAFATIIPN